MQFVISFDHIYQAGNQPWMKGSTRKFQLDCIYWPYVSNLHNMNKAFQSIDSILLCKSNINPKLHKENKFRKPY